MTIQKTNKYTVPQLEWLHANFDLSFCEVIDGVMRNVHTKEVIPIELTSYQKTRPDGQYQLGEATCGGSMPMGTNQETLESNPDIEDPTEEDRDKYQCRVGRRAPMCTEYAPSKCAVYSIDKIGRYDERVSVDKLIALVEV